MATARYWDDARSSAATPAQHHTLRFQNPHSCTLWVLVLFLECQRYKQDPPVDLVHILCPVVGQAELEIRTTEPLRSEL